MTGFSLKLRFAFRGDRRPIAGRRYSRAAASEQLGSIASRRWCNFEVAIVSPGAAAGERLLFGNPPWATPRLDLVGVLKA